MEDMAYEAGDSCVIGLIRMDQPIVLKRAPNGGWVVSQPGSTLGEMDSTAGAYSSTEDMLSALRRTL